VTTWIDPGDLLLMRLDCEFYSPEFVAHGRHVISKSKEGSLRLRSLGDLGKLVTGPFGSRLPSSLFRPVGVPLFRVQNVYPYFPDESNLVFLDPSTSLELATSEMRSGTVLISKAGRVGDACVVPRKFPVVNITEHVIGVRPGEAVDPYFLVAVLNQTFANTQLRRFGLGTILQYLGVAESRSVQIPVPSEPIQRAVGSRLRKAERLRELSAFYWRSAIELFEYESRISLNAENFIDVDAGTISTSDFRCVNVEPPVSWTNPSDSIAAQYFHPRRVHAQQIASRRVQWDALGRVATSRRKREPNVVPAHCVGLDQIDSALGVLSADGTGADQEQPSGIIYRKGDILFSRLRPYLNKVAIWPEHLGLGTGSGELLVYEAGENIEPHYLFFILKSPLGLYQVIDVTAGSTLPRVDSDVVEEIRVPRLSSDVEVRIAEFVRAAHHAWYQAQELIPITNASVEAIIDGTLNESKLHSDCEEIYQWLKQNPAPTAERRT
jgi:type I restriction enzyme, S subunit